MEAIQSCPLCAHKWALERASIYTKGGETHPGRVPLVLSVGARSLNRCPKCNSIFVTPGFVPDYSNYFDIPVDPDGKPRYLVAELEDCKKECKKELWNLELLLAPKDSRGMIPDDWLPPRRSLLDVGCGLGAFISILPSWYNRVVGVEFTSEGAEQARKLTGKLILEGDFLTLKINNGFNVVTMWNVLEHLPDPQAALKKARDLLDKDGMLVIQTPNANSFASRLFGGKWRLLHDPTHLHVYSDTQLCKSLEALEMEILEVRYPFVGTRFNTLGAYLRMAKGIFISMLNRLWIPVEMPMSPPWFKSLMVVTARRRSPSTRRGLLVVCPNCGCETENPKTTKLRAFSGSEGAPHTWYWTNVSCDVCGHDWTIKTSCKG